MYKKIISNDTEYFVKNDFLFIPLNENNKDYKEMLRWLEIQENELIIIDERE